MEKKPYTPPTITEHGDAVKATTGWGGPYWELTNPQPGSKIDWDFVFDNRE